MVPYGSTKKDPLKLDKVDLETLYNNFKEGLFDTQIKDYEYIIASRQLVDTTDAIGRYANHFGNDNQIMVCTGLQFSKKED